MKIVPVIDYLNGKAVLAKKGNRSEYQEINSILCSNPDLNNVIDGILSLGNFKTIYIADLDSIQNHKLDISIWEHICLCYTQIEFWLDLGTYTEVWHKLFSQCTNARPVLGSESYQNIGHLSKALTDLNSFKPLISIDIKNEKILGPENLLTEFKAWSYEVIILSLHQVGSEQGPDFQTLNKLCPCLKNQSIIYGGGIRDINDIQSLYEIDVSGVMIASSLHSGSIDKKMLERLFTNHF